MATDLVTIMRSAHILANDLSAGDLSALSLVGGSDAAGAEEDIILYHTLDNVPEPLPETITALEALGWKYFQEGELDEFRGSGFLRS